MRLLPYINSRGGAGRPTPGRITEICETSCFVNHRNLRNFRTFTGEAAREGPHLGGSARDCASSRAGGRAPVLACLCLRPLSWRARIFRPWATRLVAGCVRDACLVYVVEHFTHTHKHAHAHATHARTHARYWGRKEGSRRGFVRVPAYDRAAAPHTGLEYPTRMTETPGQRLCGLRRGTV